MRRILKFASSAAVAACLAAPAAAQQGVHVDGDEITIRGCVGPADSAQAPPSMLVWSRGDIMLAHAVAAAGEREAVGTTGTPAPFFYWLEDEEDLAKHVGQLVEVKGELGDFEEGEIEITRDGEFTEIEIEIDGDDEKIRVPSSWFSRAGAAGDDDKEREFDIVTRKIDVEDVRVLGPCNVQ